MQLHKLNVYLYVIFFSQESEYLYPPIIEVMIQNKVDSLIIFGMF